MAGRFHTIWKMLIIFLFVIIVSIFIFNVQEAEGGGCISVEMDETEFLVENSDGINTQTFEPTIRIENDCDSAKNISVAFTISDGEETGKTKHVYPHIYSDKNRRESNDRGMSYSVQVDEGRTILYPAIRVNFTTFADTYHFQCLVENKDDGTSVAAIDLRVEVEEYNDIAITWSDKEDKEKTVSNGTVIYYVKLTNRGNIYQEKVTVKVQHEHHLNLSHVKTEYPPNKDYINPEFYEREYEMIVAIWINAKEESGPGTFLIEVIVETLENDPPMKGHAFLELKLIIPESIDDDDVFEEPSTEISMRVKIMVGGGISAISIAVFGSYYFLALRKGREEDEEQGWGDEGSWSDDGWGSEQDEDDEDVYYGTPIADDFLNPITQQASPKVKEVPRTPSSQVPSQKIAQKEEHTTTRVSCPGCKGKLKVSNPKRPLTITCPKCDVKMTLKAKKNHASPPTPSRGTTPPTQAVSSARVKCPKCAVHVKITNSKRPLKMGCPKCSTKFTVRGKQKSGKPSDTSLTNSSAGKGSTGKAGSATRISCPKCAARIKLTNTKRPLRISCPKCDTKLNLK